MRSPRRDRRDRGEGASARRTRGLLRVEEVAGDAIPSAYAEPVHGALGVHAEDSLVPERKAPIHEAVLAPRELPIALLNLGKVFVGPALDLVSRDGGNVERCHGCLHPREEPRRLVAHAAIHGLDGRIEAGQEKPILAKGSEGALEEPGRKAEPSRLRRHQHRGDSRRRQGAPPEELPEGEDAKCGAEEAFVVEPAPLGGRERAVERLISGSEIERVNQELGETIGIGRSERSDFAHGTTGSRI